MEIVYPKDQPPGLVEDPRGRNEPLPNFRGCPRTDRIGSILPENLPVTSSSVLGVTGGMKRSNLGDVPAFCSWVAGHCIRFQEQRHHRQIKLRSRRRLGRMHDIARMLRLRIYKRHCSYTTLAYGENDILLANISTELDLTFVEPYPTSNLRA